MRFKSVVSCIVPVVFLVMAGCSSSHDSGSQGTGGEGSLLPLTGPLAKGHTPEDVKAFLSSRGLALEESVTEESSGYTGYRARFCSLKKTPGIPKYCLVLTGTPYSMGYQAARLRPGHTYEMLTRFMRIIGLEQLKQIGIAVDPFSAKGQKVYDLLYSILRDECRASERFIPEDLRCEMQGVVDGMHDAGYPDVTYDDVLVLNQGVDSTYYLLLSLVGVTQDRECSKKAVEAFVKILGIMGRPENTYAVKGDTLLVKSEGVFDDYPRAGCNEFVIGGGLTKDGQTFHGRDFMFPTAGVYQDAACVMVYLPEKGIPFATVDPAGFVGHSVGINAMGLSIGMDVCQGAAYGENLGVGCMLVARHVLDTCADLDESIDAVKGLEKGVPWIYVLADDERHPVHGCGVELETGRSGPFTGPDTLPLWEQDLLAACGYTAMLKDQPLPDRGVLTRGSTWTYPKEFTKVNIGIPVPDPFFDSLDTTYLWFYFPDQVENDPDVLVATNHFILPRMRFTEFQPLIWLMYRIEPLPESVWRYETQLSYIQDAIDCGGAAEFFGPDPETPSERSAGWMIDFLNSGRENGWFYGSTWENVEGHHTIMNNTTREIRSLFGKMADPWVGVNLEDFCCWYYLVPPECSL
ncbi:MAG TPA: carcinine hydrolase/isopenicillin-N N-acyltransferase family protein [Deltaproteobacteria bacterium]|nr:carcinine hydrolase/isopenicillin-N N-acyltransferase family protein [Deltaproteobacteria bacterium]HOI07321.1 carcinine hydrolase/isopenicillin-N N-acyltransferase family protein [Deltaproteobacteria bacterium]